jgi:hypothetical protein
MYSLQFVICEINYVLEMECVCVFVCDRARGKSHAEINVMVCNSFLKSEFCVVGFLSIRVFHNKTLANQICHGRSLDN